MEESWAWESISSHLASSTVGCGRSPKGHVLEAAYPSLLWEESGHFNSWGLVEDFGPLTEVTLENCGNLPSPPSQSWESPTPIYCPPSLSTHSWIIQSHTWVTAMFLTQDSSCILSSSSIPGQFLLILIFPAHLPLPFFFLFSDSL